VEVLACGHVALPGTGRMCPHLADPAVEDAEYVRYLTGHGMDYDL